MSEQFDLIENSFSQHNYYDIFAKLAEKRGFTTKFIKEEQDDGTCDYYIFVCFHGFENRVKEYRAFADLYDSGFGPCAINCKKLHPIGAFSQCLGLISDLNYMELMVKMHIRYNMSIPEFMLNESLSDCRFGYEVSLDENLKDTTRVSFIGMTKKMLTMYREAQVKSKLRLKLESSKAKFTHIGTEDERNIPLKKLKKMGSTQYVAIDVDSPSVYVRAFAEHADFYYNIEIYNLKYYNLLNQHDDFSKYTEKHRTLHITYLSKDYERVRHVFAFAEYPQLRRLVNTQATEYLKEKGYIRFYLPNWHLKIMNTELMLSGIKYYYFHEDEHLYDDFVPFITSYSNALILHKTFDSKIVKYFKGSRIYDPEREKEMYPTANYIDFTDNYTVVPMRLNPKEYLKKFNWN